MVGLSAWHFLRQFKKYVGLPPHAWLVQARLQKARQLLKQGGPNCHGGTTMWFF